MKLKGLLARRPKVESMQLIMDIGMHAGADTGYYLEKGFRVVGVEANSVLVEEARRAFAPYLASGQLVIEPAGVRATAARLPFYINLQNDHWSSFDKEWGARRNSPYRTVEVECITPQTLIERYGMPYYLKIDIEGSDIDVVRGLHDFRDRPRYVSIEENNESYFQELWHVGCRAFKIVDQTKHIDIRCPNPALEGRYVDASFDDVMTGPFGEEAPGEWLSLEDALETYRREVRSPTDEWMAHEHSWFDIHGRFD